MKAIFTVYAYDVLAKALLAVAGMLVIRYLPADQYARYTLAVSLVAIVTQSLSSSFNRIYIAGDEQLLARQNPSVFLGLQLAIVLLLGLALLPWAGRLDRVYWWMVLVIVANSFSDFGKTIFQRKLNFLRYSVIELLRAALTLGSLVALVHGLRVELDASRVLLAHAVVLFAVFFATIRGELCYRELFRFREALQLAGQILRGEYRCLLAYFCLMSFFLQAGVLVLGALGSTSEVATYGAACRYAMLLSLALNAVHAVLFPLLQQVQSRAEIEEIFTRHKQLVYAFVPVALLSAWVAQWVLPWIDMGKYPGAVPAFRILALSTIASFAFSPHANLVMRFKDFRFLLGLLVLSVLASVGLSVLLIPRWGATGAAVASAASMGLLNSMIYVRVRGYLGGEMRTAARAV